MSINLVGIGDASLGASQCFYFDDFLGTALSEHWSSGGNVAVANGKLTLTPGVPDPFANNEVLDVAANVDIDWVCEFIVASAGGPYFACDAPPHADAARWEMDGTTMRAIKIVNGSSTQVGSDSIVSGTAARVRIQTIGSTVNWYTQEVGAEDWQLVATDSFTWDGNGKQMRLGSVGGAGALVVDKIYQQTERIACP
jgi:hypothetical protein